MSKRLLLLFVGLAGFVLLTWFFWGGEWEAQFTLTGSVARLQQAGAWAWAGGILLLTADLALPVPSTVVISALGYSYGVFLGGIIATIGLVCSGLLGYFFGMFLGKPFAVKWLGQRDLERGRLLFAKKGGWIVALSKSLPILPEVISCTAGMVRMPFRQFLGALICGSLPTGFLYAWIGQLGREMPLWAIGLSLVMPAILWLVAWGFHRIAP